MYGLPERIRKMVRTGRRTGIQTVRVRISKVTDTNVRAQNEVYVCLKSIWARVLFCMFGFEIGFEI